MFELLEANQPEQRKKTNWTGVLICAALAPVSCSSIGLANLTSGFLYAFAWE
jgi:hypothetical protein